MDEWAQKNEWSSEGRAIEDAKLAVSIEHRKEDMKKGRVWTIVLIVIVALLSGGGGFYFGFGKGALVMATLASQNRVSDALSDVRRSVAALDAGDSVSMQRKIVVDLRVALFALDGYGPAVSYLKCQDRDRKAMESAGRYMAAHDDEPVFRNAPPLQNGLKFCAGH